MAATYFKTQSLNGNLSWWKMTQTPQNIIYIYMHMYNIYVYINYIYKYIILYLYVCTIVNP